MSGSESVEGAFLNAGESAYSLSRSLGAEGFPAACQNLVGIGLMPHVEDYLVIWGIEDVVRTHNQFHASQARSQMPRVPGAYFYHILADFGAKLSELSLVKSPEVCGTVDSVQEFVHIRESALDVGLFKSVVPVTVFFLEKQTEDECKDSERREYYHRNKVSSGGLP